MLPYLGNYHIVIRGAIETVALALLKLYSSARFGYD